MTIKRLCCACGIVAIVAARLLGRLPGYSATDPNRAAEAEG